MVFGKLQVTNDKGQLASIKWQEECGNDKQKEVNLTTENWQVESSMVAN